MHPLLVEYFQRFQTQPSRRFDYFFTQLTNPEEAWDKLPYIYGIEVFCLRLTQALLNKEKICIFSDYDTDAVTATATMYWGLVQLGFNKENISFYAPDRFSEGYGMNPEAAHRLAKENELIISVDCGINSVEEAEIVLHHPNCDLLITDHHHLHGPLPQALSVVNPRLAKHPELVQNSKCKMQNDELETTSNSPLLRGMSPSGDRGLMAQTNNENVALADTIPPNPLERGSDALHFTENSELQNVAARTARVYNQNQPNNNVDQTTSEQWRSEIDSTKTQTGFENQQELIKTWQSWTKKIFVDDLGSHPESKFLSESVTGVGVAWFCLVWLSYFWQYLKRELPDLSLPEASPAKLNNLLGFTAIGTVADCQSILEPTNRLLVRTGLQILSKAAYPFVGLKELMKRTGLQDKLQQGYLLNSQDLGFTLAPILNASGRISHASLSIRTLLAAYPDEASLLAQELIATNEERKNIVRNLISGLNQIVLDQVGSGEKVIWLEGDWNKGIIGLLASRFVSTYNLPCVVISTQEDLAVASLRAGEGFHLPLAMKQASEWLTKFGGHPAAAGFTCASQNLSKVKEVLVEELAKQAQDIIKPNINYANHLNDLPSELLELTHLPHLLWLDTEEVEPILLQETWLLDPFGQDLPIPRLMLRLKQYTIRWLGQDNKHVKLSFGQNQSVTVFNLWPENRDYFLRADGNKSLWVEAKLTQNTWNGSTRNELVAENLWIV